MQSGWTWTCSLSVISPHTNKLLATTKTQSQAGEMSLSGPYNLKHSLMHYRCDTITHESMLARDYRLISDGEKCQIATEYKLLYELWTVRILQFSSIIPENECPFWKNLLYAASSSWIKFSWLDNYLNLKLKMSLHTLWAQEGARVPKFLRKGTTVFKKPILTMTDCNEAEIGKPLIRWLLFKCPSCL